MGVKDLLNDSGLAKSAISLDEIFSSLSIRSRPWHHSQALIPYYDDPPDFRIIAKIAKKEEPQCLHSISNHLKIGGQAPRVIETLVDKLFEKFISVGVELDLSDDCIQYYC